MKHHEDEFKTLTVYGGVPIDDQIRELKRGVDIFVGTTGRVLDHIERRNINFSSIKSVVLDEADVMLKLGFKEDVERVIYNSNHKSYHIDSPNYKGLMRTGCPGMHVFSHYS